jgi:Domain of unknown function (DUF4382)
MKKRLAKILGAAFVALLAACGSSNDGPGSVTLKLTDAPGPFSAAVVTIDAVYLQGAGPEVQLFSGKHTLNLLDLANETVDLATDIAVPSGSYQQLRFVISGGYIVVDEGGQPKIYATSPDYEGLPPGAQVAGELRMPSFATSGLKVNLTNGLDVRGDRKVVLVDFVVAESYGHVAGQSGAWVMHPVVHAGEITLSGGLVVTLAPATASVTVPAGVVAVLSYGVTTVDGVTTVSEELPMLDPDANGTYEANFRYLFPRDYQLTLRPPVGSVLNTTPASPRTVTVVSNADGVAAFTLNAVAPAPAP